MRSDGGNSFEIPTNLTFQTDQTGQTSPTNPTVQTSLTSPTLPIQAATKCKWPALRCYRNAGHCF